MNYYVYNPKNGKPKTIHKYYEDAVKEAERLSIKEMQEIFILGIRAKVCPSWETKLVDFWQDVEERKQ